jgi:hypothetical protein
MATAAILSSSQCRSKKSEAVASLTSRMPPPDGFLLSRREIEAISAYIYWIAVMRPWPSHLINAEHGPGQNDRADDDILANGEAS